MALDTRVHLVELIELSAEQAPPPLTPAECAWLEAFRARDRRPDAARTAPTGGSRNAPGALPDEHPGECVTPMPRNGQDAEGKRRAGTSARTSPWLLFAYACVVALSFCLAYA